MPLLLQSTSEEAFGFLSLIWTFIFASRFLDFGLYHVIVRHVAERRPEFDARWQSWTSFAALNALMLGFALLVSVPIIKDPRWQILDAAGFALLIWPLVVANLCVAVLEGRGLYGRLALNRTVFTSGNFLLPLLVAEITTTQAALLWGLLVWKLVELLSLCHIAKLKPLPCAIKAFGMFGLFRDGAWFSLNRMLVPIYNYAERVFIVAYLGVGALSSVVPVTEIGLRAGVIAVTLAGVMFAEVSRNPRARFTQGAPLFDLVVLGFSLVCWVCIWEADALLGVWLGEQLRVEHRAVLLLTLAILSLGAGSAPMSAYLQARGRVLQIAVAGVLFFPIFLMCFPPLLDDGVVVNALVPGFGRYLLFFLGFAAFLPIVDGEFPRSLAILIGPLVAVCAAWSALTGEIPSARIGVAVGVSLALLIALRVVQVGGRVLKRNRE
jgi:hypothetical protein